jgi:hypothetical protein
MNDILRNVKLELKSLSHIVLEGGPEQLIPSAMPTKSCSASTG